MNVHSRLNILAAAERWREECPDGRGYKVVSRPYGLSIDMRLGRPTATGDQREVMFWESGPEVAAIEASASIAKAWAEQEAEAPR